MGGGAPPPPSRSILLRSNRQGCLCALFSPGAPPPGMWSPPLAWSPPPSPSVCVSLFHVEQPWSVLSAALHHGLRPPSKRRATLTEVSPSLSVEFGLWVGANIAWTSSEPNGDTSRQAFRAERHVLRPPQTASRRPGFCCTAPNNQGGNPSWHGSCYVSVPVSRVFPAAPLLCRYNIGPNLSAEGACVGSRAVFQWRFGAMRPP